MVLPGHDKSFDAFRVDNETCMQFARQQVAGATAQGVAADSGARSTALGALLGAAAGAAINGGHGAAAGAGGGAALGGLAGVDAAETSADRLQRRYDIAYEQCMYAKGNRIPVASGLMGQLFPRYQERRPPLAGSDPAPPGSR